jgi:hypothetical protein
MDESHAMGGHQMIRRTRAAVLAALSALTVVAATAPAASANPLSLLPIISCANEQASQPFAPWGDNSSYTLVPGGNFEPGTYPWALTGAAKVAPGNETYHVDGANDSQSLSLPSGSSAASPFVCTSVYHPTLRFFARNTGSASSQLNVYAVYPTLLFGIQTSKVGEITGSSSWQPSNEMRLLWGNLNATLSLDETAIAFRFVPADNTGNWSIDDVYLDPFHRA